MNRISPAFLLIILLILFGVNGACSGMAASVADTATVSFDEEGDLSTPGSAPGMEMSGIVLDCPSGKPVALATVAVKETGEVTITGSNGGFIVHFPAGVQSIHLFVDHISYVTVSNMEVSRSFESPVSICLKEKMFKAGVVEVEAKRESRRNAWGVVSLDPLMISNGAAAQTDPLFSLKELPFVSSGLDISGRFSVHGSSPEANAFYLDGLVFPSPYHLSGLCSIYDPANIGRFVFSRFPISASMLSSTSAVVDVETKDGSESVESGMVNIGVLSSTVSSQKFFADERLFASFMARRSYLDLILNNFAPSMGVRIPNFYDVQSSVVWALDPMRYLRFGVVYSGDRSYMRADRFVESEGDAGTVVDWRRELGAFYLTMGTRRGVDDWNERGRVMVAWQPYSSSFRIGGSDDEWMEWRADRVTLRWDHNRKFGRGELHTGTYTSAFFTDYRVNFGRGFWLASRDENSAVRLDNDGWVLKGEGRKKWLYSAAYSEALFGLESIDFRVGARVEAFTRSGEVVLSPRIGLRRSTGAGSAIEISFGMSARDPAEEVGNPEAYLCEDIKTEKATQLSAVCKKRISGTMDVEFGAFLRRDRNLLIELEPTVFSSTGIGRGKGIEIAFVRHGARVYVSGNYSYTRSERMDLPYSTTLSPEMVEGTVAVLKPLRVSPFWYTSPYEYRHSMSFEGRVRVSKSVNLGLKWNLRSGRPYTPIGTVYWRSDGSAVASEGEKMSARFPFYSRLDLHIDWTGERVGVFFEILNVTNRANPFNLRYNSDYSGVHYYRMIPFTPAFGIKLLL